MNKQPTYYLELLLIGGKGKLIDLSTYILVAVPLLAPRVYYSRNGQDAFSKFHEEGCKIKSFLLLINSN